MEAIISEQKRLAESLLALEKNYKKDSTSRKNESYFTKKLAEIEGHWEEFQKNDGKLLGIINSDNPYITESLFETTKKIYEKTKAIYLEGQKVLKQQTETNYALPATKTTTGTLTTTTFSDPVSSQLTGAIAYSLPTVTSSWLPMATSAFTNSNPSQWPLQTTVTPAAQPQAASSSQATIHKLPKLPPIEIPKFNGDYREWVRFIGLFKSVIHENSTIGHIQKMQYLLSYLEGDAKDAISHLQLDALNYETALIVLQERFSNNRKMVISYIDSILDAKKIEENRCAVDIINLYNVLRNCLAALKNMQYNTESWDPIIVRITMRKLDSKSLRMFEEGLDNTKEMPTVKQLCDFLIKRYETLTSIKPQYPQTQIRKKAFIATTKSCCNFCKGDHNIYRCKNFKEISVEERHKFISARKLCKNCMTHPESTKCNSKHTCYECNKPHHTLLHFPTSYPKNISSNVSTRKTYPEIVTSESYTNVLLATALVNVLSSSGEQVQLRALIDPGSQTSFISSRAVKKLLLPTQNVLASITGIGASSLTTARSKISVSLKPRFPSNFTLQVEALVLPKLTTLLPDNQVRLNRSSSIRTLNLADPTFGTPGAIDLILGVEVYEEIIENELKRGDPLLAQKTKLGWILSGRTTKHKPNQTNEVISLISMTEFHKSVERFFEMDGEEGERELSPEELKCEEHFQATHERQSSGRYTVRLPFKDEKDLKPLGYSRNNALLRYRQVEKRLKKDKTLASAYNDFLREYLELGHMEKVLPFIGDDRNVFYLPHHPVLKESSTTTKVRVVFDASAKSYDGTSLNDQLYVGPKLQQDLSQILLRWRKHKYVYTADIEKMFRQIEVAQEDRDYQRILWRKNENASIEEYRLNTVTYGTASATFLAVRVLMQLAEDEKEKHPLASAVLKNDFYVDDLMTGASTKAEARILQKEISHLLLKGGFNLRKWTSNDPELLEKIPIQAKEDGLIKITEDVSIKTLGVNWHPAKDEFQFSPLEFDKFKRLTKRQLLSNIATIYDPLQWIAPVTIRAKLLMQEVWKTGVDWDGTLSDDIISKWSKFEAELPLLKSINIPRWIHYDSKCKIELHGFSDASELAYAAAVYSRVICNSGIVKTTLLCAKTKVSPMKTKISLPKLELNGASLMAKLLHTSALALNIENLRIYAWCDSTITLGWLKKDPASLETYVANRVAKIQRLDQGKWTWGHVKSEDNPADCASRGINPRELKDHKLWWTGPQWLRNMTIPTTAGIKSLTPEQPKEVVSMAVTKTETDILERYSNFNHLIKITAICLRFIKNCRAHYEHRTIGIIQPKELDEAHRYIIKILQQTEFAKEIKEFKNNKMSNNRLSALNPFIDDYGILRVGGRLRNADISYDAKHPILLPQKHHVTFLIVRNAHEKTMHGGLQLARNYLRQKYWIINDQKVIRYEIHRCITCCKFRNKQSHQLMGDLPAVRITPSNPFTYCGVDYAGPFMTRMSKGRGSVTLKGYIALFVCMVTKAVHLELVSDMSTEAFLAAFKRFTSRRGLCLEVYSDHGTNFVGANNKIDKDIKEAILRSTDHIAKITAKDGITWKTIPVATPHFGGLWEAAVKSTKQHIKRIFDEAKIVPTFEEFTTILCQIEGCLNSRPVTPLSSDPNDLQALTPGHLLIGRSPLALPEPDKSSENLHQRWQMLTALHQRFWKRWSQEYLHNLHRRTKWIKGSDNPKVGELVLVKERDMPPSRWPLARIHEVQPGSDGKVRTVIIRYHGNRLKQEALINLCQLPVEVDQSEPTPARIKATSHVVKAGRKLNQGSQQINQPRKREASKELLKKHKRVKVAPCTWAGGLINIMIMLFLILSVGATSTPTRLNISTLASKYTILPLNMGFYIENLGYAQVMRGTLRLEVSFPTQEILKDKQNIMSTYERAREMCSQTRELSQITHCDTLTQHLEIKKNELLHKINEIERIRLSRKKRGLFGKFLTSVFGVNDEVYADIDTLEHNQKTILETINQQNLHLNTRIADANAVTTNKLLQFEEKLNQLISSINEMGKWYIKIDHNKIAIQVISAYLTASDYYKEVESKYGRVINALYGHESILSFLDLETFNKTLEKVAAKISLQLEISRFPQNRIDVKRGPHEIKIYGYFHIINSNKFDLVHVTTVPRDLGNHQYEIPIIKAPTLAIDFNHQVYFQLDDNQLKSCVTEENIYLCSPGIISNIDSNPNCVIDEIYMRHQKPSCPTLKAMSTQIAWKELMRKNTWLFVADTPTPAAITCQGEREEVLLKKSGIIHTSENCLIQTEKVTLQSTLSEERKVLRSFTKEIVPNQFNQQIEQPSENHLEPVARVSQQLFGIRPEERPITTLLEIKKHSVSAAATMTITIIILVIIFKIRKSLKSSISCKKTPPTSTTEDAGLPTSLNEGFNRAIAAGRPKCSVPEHSSSKC